MEKADNEESEKMDLFDKVLEAYGDAERVAKAAVKEDMVKGYSRDITLLAIH